MSHLVTHFPLFGPPNFFLLLIAHSDSTLLIPLTCASLHKQSTCQTNIWVLTTTRMEEEMDLSYISSIPKPVVTGMIVTCAWSLQR